VANGVEVDEGPADALGGRLDGALGDVMAAGRLGDGAVSPGDGVTGELPQPMAAIVRIATMTDGPR
jgi:hypothetical protein